jgi:hypothetical protein
MLKDGFTTMCGKARHFTLEVVEVTISVNEASCPDCLATDEFRNLQDRVNHELAAIKKARV